MFEVENTGGGAPFCLEGVTVTNPNGDGLHMLSDGSPCSVRLTSCAIADCRTTGVTANGANASLELKLVDCLVLRNGEDGVYPCNGARVQISGASSRIRSNGCPGLYSGFGGSIKVSGLGTKPALTRQEYGFRYFSGATTSALFSETGAHPNKAGDVNVLEAISGSVVFLS